MTDLESRCRVVLTALLDRIPHDMDCDARHGVAREVIAHPELCNCDRDVRVVDALSAALARAIETSVRDAYALGRSTGVNEGHPMGRGLSLAAVAEEKADAIDAALAAFGRQENP